MPLRLRLASISLGACVFASGAAGLAYEILFTRSLGLFLGHDGRASLAVLASFMGGMAIGNAWFGRRADLHPSRALLLYAGLEAAVAAYALAFPAFLFAAKAAFFGLASRLDSGGAALTLLQGIVAAAVVLPPAICMGGTLPALARVAGSDLAGLQSGVARLYAVNSFGAVLGCWIADFALMPAMGAAASLPMAAGLNLAGAAGAAALARRPVRGVPTAAAPVAPKAPMSSKAAAPGRDPARAVLIVIALSGFAAMIYEVAWMRLLALALGSTTHAFSWMLSAFIAGIGAGSWWISRRPPADSLAALARTQAALACWMALTLPFYPRLPYVFARGASWVAPDLAAYPAFALWQGAACFAVMFAPAVLLGASLPLAGRAATAAFARVGASVGGAFSANTLGAVAGALAAGLVLLPRLGLAGAFGAGVGVNAAAAVIAFNARTARASAWRRAAPAALLVAIPWLCAAGLGDLWRRSLTLGLWRNPGAVASYGEFREITRENRLQYCRDGAVATVSVNAWNAGPTENLVLRVNGKPDASTAGDMATQLLLGHLPMLLHPTAARALVVGLGSGITSGAVARHPSLERLDTVEISPEVGEAARLFGPWNHQVLDDPRMHLWIEDARSFLQRRRTVYDVIVSEPSNPWIAGVAGLFTREFYLACRDRMAPDGLMVQWVHLYDNQQEALDLVLRTLASVFPRISVWQSQERDLILVASGTPQSPGLEPLLARMADPGVAADLARAGLSRPASLLARGIVSDADGRLLADADGPIQTDDHPRLEYLAQAAFFAHQGALQWLALDQNRSPRADTFIARHLRTHGLGAEDYREFMAGAMAYGLPGTNLLRSLRLRWQAAPAGAASGQLEFLPRLPPLGSVEELEALRLGTLRQEIVAKAESNLELARYYLRLLTQIYRSQRSVFFTPPAAELRAVAERLLAADPAGRRGHQRLLAEIAWDRGDIAECLRLGRAGLDGDDWAGHAGDPDFARAAARHMEALLETGAEEEARSAGARARAARLVDPVLAFVLRKVAARDPASPPPSGDAAGGRLRAKPAPGS